MFAGAANPGVQVIEEVTGDFIYTVRVQGARFQPCAWSTGKQTDKIGCDLPNAQTVIGVGANANGGSRTTERQTKALHANQNRLRRTKLTKPLARPFFQ